MGRVRQQPRGNDMTEERRKNPPIPRDEKKDKPDWDTRRYRSTDEIKSDPKYNKVIPVHPDEKK